MFKQKKAQPEVQVIKIKPYPIAGHILVAEGKPPLAIAIQRIEEFGLVFKSTGHFFRIGEEYNCDFHLPSFDVQINQPIKVVKTTESAEAYAPGTDMEKVMTVEVHFKNKTGDFKKQIRDYLSKIHQRSP